MKKIVFLIAFFFVPVSIFAMNVNVDYALNKVWQGRRIEGVENTLWRVQDYVRSGECQDVLDMSCYKKRGKEKKLAQSLLFDGRGNDGAWFQFFAPKKVKNKGATVRIFPTDIAQSPRFFCRGGRLSRGGARRITASVAKQKAMDGTNVTWAMMLMQTGAQIFNNSLFVYSISYDANNYAMIIRGESQSKLPSHTLYINDKNAIERIEFFDKQGKVLWVIANTQIKYSDGKWQPTTTFVVNVAGKKASLMQMDNSLSFSKWPNSYNRKSLSCGR